MSDWRSRNEQRWPKRQREEYDTRQDRQWRRPARASGQIALCRDVTVSSYHDSTCGVSNGVSLKFNGPGSVMTPEVIAKLQDISKEYLESQAPEAKHAQAVMDALHAENKQMQ